MSNCALSCSLRQVPFRGEARILGSLEETLEEGGDLEGKGRRLGTGKDIALERA